MALVIDIAVPLTYNLPRTDTEKIMKYENLTLEIKNIWKLNNPSIYPLGISVEGVVTRNFVKYLENIGLTKKDLASRAKNSTVTNVSYSMEIPKACSLTLGIG
jgi:hypothetical protein